MGEKGLEVSPLCIGIVRDENVICEAFDAGINFFFVTADMHWPLYEHTRRGLEKLFKRGGGVRDEVVVGVVCYVTQPEFSHAPFQEVVDEIDGLERIDLAIAGGAYPNEIMNRLSVYEFRHRQQGYLGCRAIGTTFHDRTAALMAVNYNLLDVGFIRYNAAHPGARQDVFPHLDADSETLLYNFKSVMGYVNPQYFPRIGYDELAWQPKLTDHYRFILTRPEIDGILCAPSEVHMVHELTDALEEGALDEEEEVFLIGLAEAARRRAREIVPLDPLAGLAG